DGGVSWQELGGVIPFQFIDENTGFYYNQGLYKTVNGQDFELLGIGVDWDLLSKISVLDENVVWGTLLGLLNGDPSTRGIMKITYSESEPYMENVWYDNNPEIDMASIHFADNTGYIVG